MENKSYRLRYLPIFEQDLSSTAIYIAHREHSGREAA